LLYALPDAASGEAACRAAVFNPFHVHADVMASMAYAVQSAGCTADLYSHMMEFGMVEHVAPWLNGRAYRHEDLAKITATLLARYADYSVFVLVTFPGHPRINPEGNILPQLLQRELALPPEALRPLYVLGIHYPDLLEDTAGLNASMLQDHNIRLLSTGPHVARAAGVVLEHYEAPRKHSFWITPLIPYGDTGYWDPTKRNEICVPSRIMKKHKITHHYAILKAVNRTQDLWREHDAHLVLQGSQKDNLWNPNQIRDIVSTKSGLSFSVGKQRSHALWQWCNAWPLRLRCDCCTCQWPHLHFAVSALPNLLPLLISMTF
jgi:hypothetical protein